MNDSSSLIPALFMATFVIVLIYGVIQIAKARKAKREHHRSASAEAHGEPATGAPGRTGISGSRERR